MARKRAASKPPQLENVHLTMLVRRVDGRNHRFWSKVAPHKGQEDYGLQCHDYSHLHMSPVRGQVMAYDGPPPTHLEGGLDWDTYFQGGKYRVLKHIPEDLIIEVIPFSQFYYGIGRVKLNKLQAKFKDNLSDLRKLLAEASDEELAKGLKDAGLTTRSLEALVLGRRLGQWQLDCVNIGIDDRACRNFFEAHQWQTLDVFQKNPFSILCYAETTDYLKLWKLLQEKHTGKHAEACWAALWAIFYAASVRYQTSFDKAFLMGGLTGLLGAKEARSTFSQVIKAGHLYVQGDCYQLCPIRVFEREIANHLIDLNTPKENPSQAEILSVDWEALFNGQKSRVDLALEPTIGKLESFVNGQMLLIYGEAGTGKTYFSARILWQCLQAGWRIRVIAVSNIAVSRVRKELESVSQVGDQLEKNTRYSSVARFLLGTIKGDEPPYVLLLDEASMIGAGQALHVLSKIRQCDRLIMVGDPRQIPPIGWGALFHALQTVQKLKLNSISLTVRQRQQGSGISILDFIDQLEKGEKLIQAAKGKGGVTILEPKGKQGPLDRLESHMSSYLKKKKGKANAIPPILCLCREDVAQANSLCRELRARMDTSKAWKAGLAEFREGEPIINTINRRMIGIWNGSRGLVVNNKKGLMAEFEEPDGTKKQYRLDSGIERAYAVTVHRAQGEGHKEVILYLGEHVPETLMHRGALYTAITRASEKLIIIGSSEQFDAGYKRPNHASSTNFLKLAFDS